MGVTRSLTCVSGHERTAGWVTAAPVSGFVRGVWEVSQTTALFLMFKHARRLAADWMAADNNCKDAPSLPFELKTHIFILFQTRQSVFYHIVDGTLAFIQLSIFSVLAALRLVQE